MIVLLLLLPFASARVGLDGLTISITPAPTEAETTISHRNTDIKLLTDTEQNTFQLTKDNLKKAIETISSQKPTDVFIHETDDGIYRIYNWHEVKRNFEIKNVKTANVTVEIEKQSDKIFTNNGTEKKTVDAKVSEYHYSFHSTHYWSGNVDVSANVRYELVRPAKEALHYTYISKVGDDDFSSGVNVISYGRTRAKFDLNPGQAAKFTINANTVKTTIKVDYETKLTGDVVTRYAEKRRGKEFWAYDVNDLLKALNVSNVVETTEFVVISYFKEYLVKVVDVATGKEIPYTDLVTPDY